MTSTDGKTDLERAAGDGASRTPIEARQAIKTHHVRWMLVASLALAVMAVGASWLVFAGAQHGTVATPAVAAAQP